MANELDELFGHGAAAATPKLGRIYGVLGLGLTLAILGMGCTAVPGGVVVLVAWMLVEKELDRVDSGYLPASERPGLINLRRGVLAALAGVILLFIAQGTLLAFGFYDWLWELILVSLVDLLEAVGLVSTASTDPGVQPAPATP